MVPFSVVLGYSSSASAFGLEVSMSKKHLTYDDMTDWRSKRGSRRGSRWRRSQRTSAKTVRLLAERLKPTEDWFPHPMATTASIIRPAPESRIAVPSASGENVNARRPAGDARRAARTIKRSFVPIMRDPHLSVMPAAGGFAVGCAVCSMMQNTLRSNTRKLFLGPGGGFP